MPLRHHYVACWLLAYLCRGLPPSPRPAKGAPPPDLRPSHASEVHLQGNPLLQPLTWSTRYTESGRLVPPCLMQIWSVEAGRASARAGDAHRHRDWLTLQLARNCKATILDLPIRRDHPCTAAVAGRNVKIENVVVRFRAQTAISYALTNNNHSWKASH